MKFYKLLLIIPLLLCCSKDKYEDIPKFPKFKNDVLTFSVLDSVQIVRNKDGFWLKSNQYFDATIQDSTLFVNIISEFCNKCSTNYSNGTVGKTDGIIIRKGKVVKHIKLDIINDFPEIDNYQNYIINNELYFAKDNYNIKVRDTATNTFRTRVEKGRWRINYLDKFNILKEFDSSYIDSKTKINFAVGSDVILPIPQKEKRYFRYYQLSHENKTGLTKINETENDKEFYIFTLGNEIYCISVEEIDTKSNNIKTIKISKLK